MSRIWAGADAGATHIFPAFARALDLTDTGPLVLLTGYRTWAAIRRMGAGRLATWLRNRKVRGSAALTLAVVEAVERQHTAVAGEKATAQKVHTMAKEVMALKEKIAEVDRLIQGRSREHELTAGITSLPGIGPLLGAEFVAATNGDMAFFVTPDRLAGFADPASGPRDSGRSSGNPHRPKRYHRGLQRVFCTPALISIRSCAESRRFYDRKGAEG